MRDDITYVNADPKFDAVILRRIRIAMAKTPLQFGRAGDRIYDAGEFHQHAITGEFDDTALMLADLGINEIVPQRLQCRKGPGLVGTHEPAVSNNVGGKDGGEAAFHVTIE